MDTESVNKPESSEVIKEFVEKKDEIMKQTLASWIKNGEMRGAQTIEISEKYQAGLVFTLDMLTTAIALDDPNLLEDQIKWANIRLPHDGVSRTDMIENLLILKEVVNKIISQDNQEPIVIYLDWMIEKFKASS
jgi:hypothetical protein